MKTLKLVELLSEDIRSRSNAEKIKRSLSGFTGDVMLDFSGVKFISRSFADELCTTIENTKNIGFIRVNEAPSVKNMMDVVMASRNKQRVRTSEDADILTLSNMDEISALFATM